MIQERASLSTNKRLSRWGRLRDVTYNSRESLLKSIDNRKTRSKRSRVGTDFAENRLTNSNTGYLDRLKGSSSSSGSDGGFEI